MEQVDRWIADGAQPHRSRREAAWTIALARTPRLGDLTEDPRRPSTDAIVLRSSTNPILTSRPSEPRTANIMGDPRGRPTMPARSSADMAGHPKSIPPWPAPAASKSRASWSMWSSSTKCGGWIVHRLDWRTEEIERGGIVARGASGLPFALLSGSHAGRPCRLSWTRPAPLNREVRWTDRARRTRRSFSRRRCPDLSMCRASWPVSGASGSRRGHRCRGVGRGRGAARRGRAGRSRRRAGYVGDGRWKSAERRPSLAPRCAGAEGGEPLIPAGGRVHRRCGRGRPPQSTCPCPPACSICSTPRRRRLFRPSAPPIDQGILSSSKPSPHSRICYDSVNGRASP